MRLGRAAEEVAADYYRSAGLQLLGRNIRLGALEIDLVVRDGPLVIIVEVRTRRPGALVGAFASISLSKRRRLRAASERLWERLRDDHTIERIRVDALSVDLSRSPVSVEIAEAIC